METTSEKQKFYYRIGEIAKELQVNTSLLRYWEKEFSSFINPRRNKRGVRLYTQDEFALFKQLHTYIKVQGLTLKGTHEKLKQNNKAFKDKSEIIRALSGLKQFLTDLKSNLNKTSNS